MAASSSEAYDVFLNFRGKDTRKNLISYLYAALRGNGIRVFLDDEGINRGDELSTTLLGAIERSKISVITFSENYASSAWCLDELAKIIECNRTRGQIILPIFYNVPPEHVRKQREKYQAAFIEHEKCNQSKVQKWKDALCEAANIRGWDSAETRSDFELVMAVVKDVLQKMNDIMDPLVPRRLVGIDKSIAEVESSLRHGRSDDVSKVGEEVMLMARKPVQLSELDLDIETSRIEVRVFRLWIAERNSNENHWSIEMLLIDKNADKIQAIAFGKHLCEKYKAKLSEGRCYVIQNFQVKKNDQDFRATQHSYRIQFHHNTSIQPLKVDLPLHSYTFTPFKDILASETHAKILIDVIGELQSHEKIECRPNGHVKKNIYLKDENQITLMCALWGELAKYVENFIHDTKENSFIVIFQLARLKPIKEGNILTNSWNASKVIFNPNIPQAMKLKRSLEFSNESPSQRFVPIESQGFKSIKEDWKNSCTKKTIQEIRATKEVGIATTVATVKTLPTRFNWYYIACDRCDKKVKAINEKPMCLTCNKEPDNTIAKYKVQLQVHDPTGKAIFVLFEREAMQMIGLSADYLFQRQLREDEEDTFPVELDCFLKKTFLFKVEISNYNVNSDRYEDSSTSYTILEISNDEKRIGKFKANSAFYQDLTSQNLSILSSSSSQQRNPGSDAVSLTSEQMTNLSNADNITPIKRLRTDDDDDAIRKIFCHSSRNASKLKRLIEIVHKEKQIHC